MSKIEWTDQTWNPLTGCEHVSPGCDGCYAAREAAGRLSRLPAYEGLAIRRPGELARFTGEVRLLRDRLDQPLRWRKPRRVFVNSMSDLFHRDVPDDFIAEVWDVMVRASHHQFQVLTKRPQRMRTALGPSGIGFYACDGPVPCPQPNVWLGTSVESGRYAWRIAHLAETPAAVRFLSIEPLIADPDPIVAAIREHAGALGWVIVGGESGPKARPMHPDWARSIRRVCEEEGIPFLFKQWGEWGPVDRDRAEVMLHVDGRCSPYEGTVTEVRDPHSDRVARRDDLIDRGHPGWERMARVGKRAAGRALDGVVHDGFPA